MGDFFRINVGVDFVSVWDVWLQNGIMAARLALGSRWESCYMSAPIWRFTLSPGLAGSHGAQGVLMPSVDLVGRSFPLTIVRPLARETAILDAHLRAAERFEELELLALDALEDMTRDGLAERLSGLSHAGPTGKKSNFTWTGTPPDCLRNPSLWSAIVAEGSLNIACDQLPGPGVMQGLFNVEDPIWNVEYASGRILP